MQRHRAQCWCNRQHFDINSTFNLTYIHVFIIWLNWSMVKRSILIGSLSVPYFALLYIYSLKTHKVNFHLPTGVFQPNGTYYLLMSERKDTSNHELRIIFELF